MSRSGLREQVMERDHWRCIWPACGRPAVELAHFHSIGVGGRPSADDMSNVGALCFAHARHSDGERDGGETAYTRSMIDLFGAEYASIPQDRIAYERAEALTRIVADG